jgi:DnaJ-class molecular chaperone
VVGCTEDGQRVVGQIAQRQAILNPESTIDCLKGKGMPNPKGSAGDLYVTAQIKVPKKLSDRERELYEALRAASGFDPRA